MKTHFICPLYFLITVLVISLSGCDENPVESSYNGNLLSNGSFEKNNIASLEGWRFGNKQLSELVNDTPPNGGSWSLQLTSDWTPTTGYVYTPVSNVTNGDILKLSAFVRGTGRYGGKGIITLFTGSINNPESIKSSFSSDTVWTQISITDTLSLEKNDTLWVLLSSPATEIIPFQQMFDLVKLEKISN